jgi:hypothetical protein
MYYGEIQELSRQFDEKKPVPSKQINLYENHKVAMKPHSKSIVFIVLIFSRIK